MPLNKALDFQAAQPRLAEGSKECGSGYNGLGEGLDCSGSSEWFHSQTALDDAPLRAGTQLPYLLRYGNGPDKTVY